MKNAVAKFPSDALPRFSVRRWVRRVLVLLLYVAVPLLVLGFFALPKPWRDGLFYTWVVLTLLAGVVGRLRRPRRPVSPVTAPDDTEPQMVMDEREVAVQGWAHTLAFKIFGFVISLGVIYLAIALNDTVREDLILPLPNSDQWLNVLFFVLLLYGTLPWAVLAWNEPDLPEDR